MALTCHMCEAGLVPREQGGIRQISRALRCGFRDGRLNESPAAAYSHISAGIGLHTDGVVPVSFTSQSESWPTII